MARKKRASNKSPKEKARIKQLKAKAKFKQEMAAKFGRK